ncbi:MAG: acyltransferase [Candidatus Dojkabacteria bacterium]|jgi:acetyltransferase-like isoleucine patch superfamily enzyme|nr:acyltransferase [Candidatus Dojkabacteria bacterium]
MRLEEDFNKKEYIELGENIRIHPDAEISAGSLIGEGTLIMDSKMGNVEIGKDCIIGNFSMIEDEVVIRDGSKVWHFCHIRNGVKIGKNCNLGDYVFIDSGVIIGDDTKIQNYVPVYHGVEMEDGVFLGPNCLTTNDMIPRARTEDGEIKGRTDWQVTAIHIGKDASIGAGSVLRPGIKIGEKALIGAGSVVTKDVPAGAVMVGNPAKVLKYIDGYEPK